MVKGDYVIFKGPLKDNTGKTVIAAGAAAQADRHRARADELSGRGRHRQGLTLVMGPARAGRLGPAAEALAIPIGALAAAMVVFGAVHGGARARIRSRSTR